MWIQVHTALAWDEALGKLPWPHVLQSWAWGEFKSRWGWQAERWQFTSPDAPSSAGVQVLRRGLARLPLCVLYAPKGPVCRDLAAYDAALAFLEARARRQRALWVKVDGDISLDPDGAHLEPLRRRLRARGWRYSPSQVQFRNTAVSDIGRSDDALLAAMKPKTRYNVRLADKRGVRVRIASPIGDADARLLYAMYAETAQRDGFLIRDAAYYFDAWRAMNAIGLIAERDGQALAGLVMFIHGARAWYFYGMSRTEGREHMPSYALQWHAMRWARDHGCRVYDWWGAPDVLDERDPLWGVYRFKEGFGVQFIEGIGAWDYAPWPLLYRVYTKFGPRLIRGGLIG